MDTKLARHVKASALLQICSYVEQLTRIQGTEPEWMHVALGGSARTVERHRVADYMAYYRTVKAAFEARVRADGGAAAVYPPAASRTPSRWSTATCAAGAWSARRGAGRTTTSLSLPARRPGCAGPSRSREWPRAAAWRPWNCHCRSPSRAWAGRPWPRRATRPRSRSAARTAAGCFTSCCRRAGCANGALEPNRGLTSLPPPRPGDLFFDIEGDPFALDDGVDYLFGILEPGLAGPDGGPTFHAFWGVDENGRVTHRVREARLRAGDRPDDGPAGEGSGDPRLPLRAVRADGSRSA